MHSERARGNADKLKQEKFQLAITTKLFTMRVMQHWKRLPRSGYLHPEDTKNLPRQDIEQPDLSLKLVLSWTQPWNRWCPEAPAHLNFWNWMPELLFAHPGITYPKILLFWTISNETVQSFYWREKSLTNYWRMSVIDGM